MEIYENQSSNKKSQNNPVSNFRVVDVILFQGQYKAVCSTYSSHLREIVDVLLTTDPERRPGVEIVLNQVRGFLIRTSEHLQSCQFPMSKMPLVEREAIC
jgi:hypothetical protein